VVGRLDDAPGCAGVGQVPRDLRGRARLVDRHHDGAGEEQAEVDERPVVRRAGDEADLVAGFDTRRDEAFR
jgi:hypothetical protein